MLVSYAALLHNSKPERGPVKTSKLIVLTAGYSAL
jgi:hypothetical protein